jgi:hypothetical protein
MDAQFKKKIRTDRAEVLKVNEKASARTLALPLVIRVGFFDSSFLHIQITNFTF